jgi:6-pyruvoyl-tetrahydropterin synthase
VIQVSSAPSQGQNSSIFVRHVTILDCAVAHPMRGPVGQSWWVDVEWEGQLDENSVVFDFGLAKKAAKKIIDEQFDHRLLLEQKHLLDRKSERVLISCKKLDSDQLSFAMDCYENAVVFLADKTLDEVCLNGNFASLEKQIAQAVKNESPSNVTSVKVTLTEHPDRLAPNYFSYTHSLRNHFGNCQRFHGHSNIIEVFENGVFSDRLSLFAKNLLSDRYLVARDYFSSSEENCFEELMSKVQNSAHGNFAYVRYQGSQGTVQLMLPKALTIPFDNESSIENISQFVLRHVLIGFPELNSADVKVLAYEGLGKGSTSRRSV